MKKFAVFDIDGTLIRWQLYHVIVDRLAANGELAPGSHEILKAARRKWKNREHAESFGEYEQTLIKVYESSLETINAAVFDELVHAVIEEYQDQIYTFTKKLATSLKQEGYILLAISGSHHELVEKVAQKYHFDDWVGTKYERTGGGYSGDAFIASHHKAEVLQSLITKHGLSTTQSYAIGDSKSDAPMLAMVENPIAFNPDTHLYNIAHGKRWDIVLERKNMIYRLKYEHGNYILAEAGNDATL